MINISSRYARMFSRAVNVIQPADVIKSIVMIGAFVDEEAGALGANDEVFLSYAFSELAKADIAIDPDAEIMVCNKVYGDDFFRDRPQADLHILCAPYFNVDEKSEFAVTGEGITWQSPLLFEEGKRWGTSLKEVHAKYVANFSDNMSMVKDVELMGSFNAFQACNVDFDDDGPQMTMVSYDAKASGSRQLVVDLLIENMSAGNGHALYL